MTIKELDFHVASSVGQTYLTDDDGERVAVMEGGVSRAAQDLANEITDRYNAPLIILGRVEELRAVDERLRPQWRVILEGQRALMTWAEIEDYTNALPFVG